MIATGIGSFALMGAMIQTPGVSQLVGCRPMGSVGWMTGSAGAVIGTAVGMAGPWIERTVTGSDDASWSNAIVGRLTTIAPEIPGLLEA